MNDPPNTIDVAADLATFSIEPTFVPPPPLGLFRSCEPAAGIMPAWPNKAGDPIPTTNAQDCGPKSHRYASG
jgi:hypothetical protein